MKIKDVMSTEVVTVGPETPVKEVARILGERRVSGVPVVSEEGDVVGVISESDVVAREAGFTLETEVERKRFSLRRKHEPMVAPARRASDVMTAPAITMEPYRSVSSAAQRMSERRIHRIPVVSHGALIGIVSAGDLVRAFARPDDEIAGEVRDEIRERLEVIGDSRVVDVSLEDGCVTLLGTVTRRSTAESLVTAARGVPGVIEVRSRLDWIEDDSKVERATRTRGYW